MDGPPRPPALSGATGRQLLLVAAGLALWVLLQLVVLPKLGVST